MFYVKYMFQYSSWLNLDCFKIILETFLCLSLDCTVMVVQVDHVMVFPVKSSLMSHVVYNGLNAIF